jgi:hypothetical protein
MAMAMVRKNYKRSKKEVVPEFLENLYPFIK